MNTERGYAVVWVLVTVALFALAMTGIAFTSDSPTPAPAYLIFGAALGVAALGLYVELKRDAYVFSMFAVLFGSVTAMITGSVALLGQERHPVAVLVALLTTATVVASVVYILRMQYGREILPNLLRQEFPRSAIYEVDGVQFAATFGAGELEPENGLAIRVVAQNCWDVPRTLVFGLRSERRISFNKAGAHFPPEPSLVIPGASVAVLTIPVVMHPNANGRYALLADPRVQGSGGTRVRRWRAQGLNSSIPTWLTAIGPFLGFLVWGGGMKFKFQVRGTKGNADVEVSVPPPTEEVVWTPGPGLADEVVR